MLERNTRREDETEEWEEGWNDKRAAGSEEGNELKDCDTRDLFPMGTHASRAISRGERRRPAGTRAGRNCDDTLTPRGRRGRWNCLRVIFHVVVL